MHVVCSAKTHMCIKPCPGIHEAMTPWFKQRVWHRTAELASTWHWPVSGHGTPLKAALQRCSAPSCMQLRSRADWKRVSFLTLGQMRDARTTRGIIASLPSPACNDPNSRKYAWSVTPHFLLYPARLSHRQVKQCHRCDAPQLTCGTRTCQQEAWRQRRTSWLQLMEVRYITPQPSFLARNVVQYSCYYNERLQAKLRHYTSVNVGARHHELLAHLSPRPAA